MKDNRYHAHIKVYISSIVYYKFVKNLERFFLGLKSLDMGIKCREREVLKRELVIGACNF